MLFWGSHFEAINLLQKPDLNKEVENYKKTLKVYIKIGKKIYKFTSRSWFKQKKWKIINEKNYKKNLRSHIKMDKEIVKFDDTEIEKYNFHQHKSY